MIKIASLVGKVTLVKKLDHETMKINNLEVRITDRSEEHTSELQSRQYLVCRLLLEKKKKIIKIIIKTKMIPAVHSNTTMDVYQ